MREHLRRKIYLTTKKRTQHFINAICISYPNQNDIENAKKLGVSPGGFTVIHGQRNGLGWLSFVSQFFNWINDCIAVTSSEMEEIWQAVNAGTPIEIVQ